jgi:trans-aconitate 2-methyltransferase
MDTPSWLPRTVEPELMEDPEQVAAYVAADFTEADAAFVAACAAFLTERGALEPRTILDLGCGPGNIALRLAEVFPQADITGLDGSAAMIAAAAQRTPAGTARVAWVTATLPWEAEPARRFDLVVSNSLLHHLHDPKVMWDAVGRHANPGGLFFVGDLRRPQSAEAVARCLAETLPPEVPAVLRHDFTASLHAAFTVEEVAAQLAEAGLAGEVAAVGGRHLRAWGAAR